MRVNGIRISNIIKYSTQPWSLRKKLIKNTFIPDDNIIPDDFVFSRGPRPSDYVSISFSFITIIIFLLYLKRVQYVYRVIHDYET